MSLIKKTRQRLRCMQTSIKFFQPVMLLLMLTGCAAHITLPNHTFVERYGNVSFDDFFNTAITVRSVYPNEKIIFASTLDKSMPCKAPFIITVDPNSNEIKETSRKLLAETCEVDEARMKDLVSIFLIFDIAALSVDSLRGKPAHHEQLNILPSCDEIISKEVEDVMFSCLGKDFVLNTFNKSNRLYFTLTLDSAARVVDVSIRKTDKLSIKQEGLLESALKTKILCLVNSDPHLSYEEFIKIGKNSYKYVCPYPSYYNQQ